MKIASNAESNNTYKPKVHQKFN